MMQPFLKGRYQARLASSQADILAAQRLRWRCFLSRSNDDDDGTQIDTDALDAECHHVLVEDLTTGQLVCCFRFLVLSDGSEIARSYSAQFYNLAALEKFGGRMIELGRFCVEPTAKDPNIIRVALASVARYVNENGIELLFGCSSFIGTEPKDHSDAFAMLRDGYLAPPRWLPKIKAPQVFRYTRTSRKGVVDVKRARAAMPPLLRSYLSMGGWVSDHAVVDTALKTIHVFTGVEVRGIPPAIRRMFYVPTPDDSVI